MRIALLAPGGVGRDGEHDSFPYLVALVERLARAHDVQVFALHQEPRPARYQALGATVHVGGAYGSGRRQAYRRALWDLAREHARARFDVLHALWLLPPGLLAAFARGWIRAPLLTHVAGGELVALPDIGYGWRLSRRGRLWVRLALAGATRLSAASGPMIDGLAALGYRAERIPFGVDLARWPALAPRVRAPGAPARLLQVGSLNAVKDPATVVRAAAALAARGVRFRLDVAGVDTLAGAVAELAGTLGVGDLIEFHGLLPPAQVRALAARADLLLVSSRHEAGPFAMREAAVAGVPTVGTAVGHVAEWAPGAAVAVPVGDAAALAREAAALLDDEPRRLRLAAAAQARAVAEDADWTAARVEQVYRELVSEARPRGHGR
jgi:glycosyltransferase involved in cell wall biosynthesis